MSKYYTEMGKILAPLGFIQKKPGIFYHSLCDQTFDFSACSIPGTIHRIMDTGYNNGVEATKDGIKSILGIKDTVPADEKWAGQDWD